jgi:hypothetical protein
MELQILVIGKKARETFLCPQGLFSSTVYNPNSTWWANTFDEIIGSHNKTCWKVILDISTVLVDLFIMMIKDALLMSFSINVDDCYHQ